MSLARIAFGIAAWAALGTTEPTPAAAAAPDPVALQLQRCAGISAPDVRLACYDALAQRPKDSLPGVAASAPTPVRAPAAAPAPGALPSSPSSPAAPTVVAVPAPAATSDATTAALTDPKNFGLTLAQQHLAYAGAQSIEARIESTGAGQNGQTSMLLDNGQTWTVVSESDSWISAGQTVTIKRAALGSFLMLTASHHSYHVRRLR